MTVDYQITDFEKYKCSIVSPRFPCLQSFFSSSALFSQKGTKMALSTVSQLHRASNCSSMARSTQAVTLTTERFLTYVEPTNQRPELLQVTIFLGVKIQINSHPI